jgi:Ras-related protein Rab-5C
LEKGKKRHSVVGREIVPIRIGKGAVEGVKRTVFPTISLKGTGNRLLIVPITRSQYLLFFVFIPLSNMSDEDLTVLESKIVILGHTGVGKTSLVNQYVRGTFTGTTQATIGAAFMKKDVIKDNHRIIFQIWDTAGQERFRAMAPMYYRGAHAAILVFDVTSPDTLDKISGWVEELQDHANEDIVMVLAANKCDLPTEEGKSVSTSQSSAFADQIPAKLFETSAKSGQGISELFAHVAEQLLENSKKQKTSGGSADTTSSKKNGVKLDDFSDLNMSSNKGKCCG